MVIKMMNVKVNGLSDEFVSMGVFSILARLGLPKNGLHLQALIAFHKNDDCTLEGILRHHPETDSFVLCLVCLLPASKNTPETKELLIKSANLACDYVRHRTLKDLANEMGLNLESREPDHGSEISDRQYR